MKKKTVIILSAALIVETLVLFIGGAFLLTNSSFKKNNVTESPSATSVSPAEESVSPAESDTRTSESQTKSASKKTKEDDKPYVPPVYDDDYVTKLINSATVRVGKYTNGFDAVLADTPVYSFVPEKEGLKTGNKEIIQLANKIRRSEKSKTGELDKESTLVFTFNYPNDGVDYAYFIDKNGNAYYAPMSFSSSNFVNFQNGKYSTLADGKEAYAALSSCLSEGLALKSNAASVLEQLETENFYLKFSSCLAIKNVANGEDKKSRRIEYEITVVPDALCQKYQKMKDEGQSFHLTYPEFQTFCMSDKWNTIVTHLTRENACTVKFPDGTSIRFEDNSFVLEAGFNLYCKAMARVVGSQLPEEVVGNETNAEFFNLYQQYRADYLTYVASRSSALPKIVDSFLSTFDSGYRRAYLAKEFGKKYLTFDVSDSNIICEVGVLLFDEQNKYKTEAAYRKAICRAYVEPGLPKPASDTDSNDILAIVNFEDGEISVVYRNTYMSNTIQKFPTPELLTMSYDPKTDKLRDIAWIY